jgi:hypothetical protein
VIGHRLSSFVVHYMSTSMPGPADGLNAFSVVAQRSGRILR